MTGQFRQEQMKLGEVPSEDIYINPRSRDDVPKILRGIRSFVSNKEFTFALENILEAGFLPGSDSGHGRPEIELRRVFVLGVLKQRPGCVFDRLLHHANEDEFVRKFLGHADFIGKCECRRQTLADNIRHPRRRYRQDQRAGHEARPRNRGKEARRIVARAWRLVPVGARWAPPDGHRYSSGRDDRGAPHRERAFRRPRPDRPASKAAPDGQHPRGVLVGSQDPPRPA